MAICKFALAKGETKQCWRYDEFEPEWKCVKDGGAGCLIYPTLKRGQHGR